MSNAKEKLPEDVAERASKMPRNAVLLYRNKTPEDTTSSHYRGLLRFEDGSSFWVGLWVRRIDQERVLEIKLSRKT
jgi:hypothetical protein